jgi:hypothetical protein
MEANEQALKENIIKCLRKHPQATWERIVFSLGTAMENRGSLAIALSELSDSGRIVTRSFPGFPTVQTRYSLPA